MTHAMPVGCGGSPVYEVEVRRARRRKQAVLEQLEVHVRARRERLLGALQHLGTDVEARKRRHVAVDLRGDAPTAAPDLRDDAVGRHESL